MLFLFIIIMFMMSYHQALVEVPQQTLTHSFQWIITNFQKSKPRISDLHHIAY